MPRACSTWIGGGGYGKRDRVSHSAELPEEIQMDSSARTRKIDRVPDSGKKVGLVRKSL